MALRERMGIALGAVITLALASQAAAQSSKGDPGKGAALFKQRCSVCHSVAIPPAPGVAPNLAGVVGRKAASTDFKYSSALKASILRAPAKLDDLAASPSFAARRH